MDAGATSQASATRLGPFFKVAWDIYERLGLMHDASAYKGLEWREKQVVEFAPGAKPSRTKLRKDVLHEGRIMGFKPGQGPTVKNEDVVVLAFYPPVFAKVSDDWLKWRLASIFDPTFIADSKGAQQKLRRAFYLAVISIFRGAHPKPSAAWDSLVERFVLEHRCCLCLDAKKDVVQQHICSNATFEILLVGDLEFSPPTGASSPERALREFLDSREEIMDPVQFALFGLVLSDYGEFRLLERGTQVGGATRDSQPKGNVIAPGFPISQGSVMRPRGGKAPRQNVSRLVMLQNQHADLATAGMSCFRQSLVKMHGKDAEDENLQIPSWLSAVFAHSSQAHYILRANAEPNYVTPWMPAFLDISSLALIRLSVAVELQDILHLAHLCASLGTSSPLCSKPSAKWAKVPAYEFLNNLMRPYGGEYYEYYGWDVCPFKVLWPGALERFSEILAESDQYVVPDIQPAEALGRDGIVLPFWGVVLHRSWKKVCQLFNDIGLHGKHDGELLGKVIARGVHENLPARLPELHGMRQPMGLLHDVIGFEEFYSFAKLNVHASVAEIRAAQKSSANGAACNRVVAEGSVMQVLGVILLEGGANLLAQKRSCALGVAKREVAGLLMERFFRQGFQRGKWDSQPLSSGQLLQKSAALSNICYASHPAAVEVKQRLEAGEVPDGLEKLACLFVNDEQYYGSPKLSLDIVRVPENPQLNPQGNVARYEPVADVGFAGAAPGKSLASTALEVAPYEASCPAAAKVVPQEVPCRTSVPVLGGAVSHIALADRGRVNRSATSPESGPALGLGGVRSQSSPRATLNPVQAARAANLSASRPSQALDNSHHESPPRSARDEDGMESEARIGPGLKAVDLPSHPASRVPADAPRSAPAEDFSPAAGNNLAGRKVARDVRGATGAEGGARLNLENARGGPCSGPRDKTGTKSNDRSKAQTAPDSISADGASDPTSRLPAAAPGSAPEEGCSPADGDEFSNRAAREEAHDIRGKGEGLSSDLEKAGGGPFSDAGDTTDTDSFGRLAVQAGPDSVVVDHASAIEAPHPAQERAMRYPAASSGSAPEDDCWPPSGAGAELVGRRASHDVRGAIGMEGEPSSYSKKASGGLYSGSRSGTGAESSDRSAAQTSPDTMDVDHANLLEASDTAIASDSSRHAAAVPGPAPEVHCLPSSGAKLAGRQDPHFVADTTSPKVARRSDAGGSLDILATNPKSVGAEKPREKAVSAQRPLHARRDLRGKLALLHVYGPEEFDDSSAGPPPPKKKRTVDATGSIGERLQPRHGNRPNRPLIEDSAEISKLRLCAWDVSNISWRHVVFSRKVPSSPVSMERSSNSYLVLGRMCVPGADVNPWIFGWGNAHLSAEKVFIAVLYSFSPRSYLLDGHERTSRKIPQAQWSVPTDFASSDEYCAYQATLAIIEALGEMRRQCTEIVENVIPPWGALRHLGSYSRVFTPAQLSGFAAVPDEDQYRSSAHVLFDYPGLPVQTKFSVFDFSLSMKLTECNHQSLVPVVTAGDFERSCCCGIRAKVNDFVQVRFDARPGKHHGTYDGYFWENQVEGELYKLIGFVTATYSDFASRNVVVRLLMPSRLWFSFRPESPEDAVEHGFGKWYSPRVCSIHITVVGSCQGTASDLKALSVCSDAESNLAPDDNKSRLSALAQTIQSRALQEFALSQEHMRLTMDEYGIFSAICSDCLLDADQVSVVKALVMSFRNTSVDSQQGIAAVLEGGAGTGKSRVMAAFFKCLLALHPFTWPDLSVRTEVPMRIAVAVASNSGCEAMLTKLTGFGLRVVFVSKSKHLKSDLAASLAKYRTDSLAKNLGAHSPGPWSTEVVMEGIGIKTSIERAILRTREEAREADKKCQQLQEKLGRLQHEGPCDDHLELYAREKYDKALESLRKRKSIADAIRNAAGSRLRNYVIPAAHVFVGTPAGLSSSEVLKGERPYYVHVLACDEVNQMPRMSIFQLAALPALMQSKFTFICGDMKQMVQRLPVPHADLVQYSKIGLQGILMSSHSRVINEGTPSAGWKDITPACVFALKVNHRSVPEIVDLASSVAYEGGMTACLQPRTYCPAEFSAIGNVAYVDCVLAKDCKKERYGAGSRRASGHGGNQAMSNKGQISRAVDFAECLAISCSDSFYAISGVRLRSRKAKKRLSVRILCSHVGGVLEANDFIESSPLLKEGDVYATTVDSYQGGESDVVLYPTIESGPVRPGRDTEFSGCPRRGLVGMTRGKFVTVIFGDSAYHSGCDDPFWKNVYTHCLRNDYVWTAEEFDTVLESCTGPSSWVPTSYV